MFKISRFSQNSYVKVAKLNNSICRVASVSTKPDISTRTSHKKLLNQILNIQVFTSCFLSMFLSINQIALAGYQPPKDQKPPNGYSDSSGIRVGSKTKTNSSQDDVNAKKQTDSTLFASDSQPRARQFNLYEFDSSANNNIHPKSGRDYLAQNKFLASTSRQTIDEFLKSLFISFVKLEKLDITSVLVTWVHINNRW